VPRKRGSSGKEKEGIFPILSLSRHGRKVRAVKTKKEKGRSYSIPSLDQKIPFKKNKGRGEQTSPHAAVEKGGESQLFCYFGATLVVRKEKKSRTLSFSKS